MGKWQIKIGLTIVAVIALYLAYKKKIGPFGDPDLMGLFQFGKDKAAPPAIPELVAGGDIPGPAAGKSPNAFQGPSQGIGTGNLTTPQTKPDEEVRQTFMREMYKQTYLPFSEYPFLYDNPSYLNPNNPTGVPVRGGDLPPCAPNDTQWYDMWYKLYGFYPPGSTQTNCTPQTTPPVVAQQPPIPELYPEPIPIPDGAGGWEGGEPSAGCWPCPTGYTCTAQCYPKTGPVPPYYIGNCDDICEPFKNTVYYEKCRDGCKWGCTPDKRWSMCRHECVAKDMTEAQACPACWEQPGYRWSHCKHRCVPESLTEARLCPPPPPPPRPAPRPAPKPSGCILQMKNISICSGCTRVGSIRLGSRCSTSRYASTEPQPEPRRVPQRTVSTPGVGYAFYGTQKPIGEIIALSGRVHLS